MGGCTNCGQKGGCDTRKSGMFAAIDEALARLYPTRRWEERDEEMALRDGISAHEGEALAGALAKRLGTVAVFRPGDPDEWCDYIYVLCLGRPPAIVELREQQSGRPGGGRWSGEEVGQAVGQAGEGAGTNGDDDGDDDREMGDVGVDLDERYLRVVLSGVTRFAGVQEVAMTLHRQGGDTVITETARGGVFDPILLPRMQAVVAVLAEWDIRHIDFGEIVEAPAGFDAASYTARFGTPPVIANYLFYPQPPTTVSTVVLSAVPSLISSG